MKALPLIEVSPKAIRVQIESRVLTILIAETILCPNTARSILSMDGINKSITPSQIRVTTICGCVTQ